MSNQISQDLEKVEEYLRIIQERIIGPIGETDIQQSCTATLMLLFAAIDGLGKLLHPDCHAGSNQRIRTFLDYMDGGYKIHKKQLLELRNSLMHNAINVESFLSKTEIDASQHLNIIGSVGFIFVNTKIMYKDFRSAFERFYSDIHTQPVLLKQAASRLEWRKDEPQDYIDPNLPSPSLPPAVVFIYVN